MGDPLLDMFEHSNWGAFHSLGKLGVSASHMIAFDVNGDKKPDVLIAASKGVRFYLGGGPAAPVAEATKAWGLENVIATQAAFGDVVGRAMASADVNGDRKADLLLVTDKGVRFYEGSGLKSPFVEATQKVGLAGVAKFDVAVWKDKERRLPRTTDHSATTASLMSLPSRTWDRFDIP